MVPPKISISGTVEDDQDLLTHTPPQAAWDGFSPKDFMAIKIRNFAKNSVGSVGEIALNFSM